MTVKLCAANMFGTVVVVGMVVVLIDFEMEIGELFALFGADAAATHAPRNGPGTQQRRVLFARFLLHPLGYYRYTDSGDRLLLS